MKKINRSAAALALLLGSAGLIYGQAQLQTVRIMGKTFYCYESKKGETLDEIARQYGWDKATLERINPDAGSKPDAGTMIFYPVGTSQGRAASAGAQSPASPTSDAAQASTPRTESAPPASDTRPADASSSSEQASTPLTESAPSASESMTASGSQGGYIFHTVEHDESLYGIARKYDTSIEEIFRVNPGLGAGTLRAGIIIRIPADGKAPERYTEMVKEEEVAAVSTYKVKRGDSWGTLADTFNLTETTLREANPGVEKLTKGMTINIPVVNTVEVEKEFIAEDPRERNAEGVQELYNEVHALSESDKERYSINDTPTVGVAVVLTDIGKTADEKRNKQNKEMEFARGAIAAVDAMKLKDFKTRLTVLDGSLPDEDISAALDEFNPSMIISTSDTGLPQYLTDYVADKHVMLVNAFDAQDQTYTENAKVVQYLVPTSYMNQEIADYFSDKFADYKLIVAGTPDAKDSMGASIIEAFARRGADRVEEVEISAMPETILEGDGKFLIYGTPTASKDVKTLLENISAMRNTNILADIRVVGRPNWVTLTSSLGQQMGDNYVYLPSRFYFDPEEKATKDFIDHYESLFKLRPMKAAPVYCATAYDIMTYFVPNLAKSGGDFNATFTDYPTLQSPMGLDRTTTWSGIVNKGVYVLSFMPYGPVERIVLK